ncbi:MAG: pyrroline-5-carboxylate reductase [Clostridiales bacterium]|jgi:pyrroline-5-carboxylate reductase|nr:pyrroline-5-carboxylate reductase [Clostridiales bacterium]
MALFGFLGVGNMGYPLLKAAINTFGKDEVIYTSATKARREAIFQETGIPYLEDNRAVTKQCEYLILAVKPQIYPHILDEIKDAVHENQIIISLAVGITIESIKKSLSKTIKVVRAMPNTPALVSKGMTGISFSEDDFSEDERNIIDRFFSSFGKYEVFDENLMNAVACASGSSPAYAYLFIEALADSVVSYGIPRDKAYSLAAQTLLGAASMVMETGEHPGRLKDRVCSPGGTTIAAVKALEEYGFRNAIMKATDACYNRSKELSKN